MEIKHKCKLCLRSFANGRALGGHMRSHMMNLYVPPKPKKHLEEEEQEKIDHHFSEEMESQPSSSASSSSSEGEGEEEVEEIGNRGLMSTGLREKPRKRRCLVDPEFSFAVEATNSVVLQDRESETESSKKSTCRRSKRIRRSRISGTQRLSSYNIKEEPHVEKPKCETEGKSPIGSPLVEHEPVSSISETTHEEDVAYCLMMLSRDKWNEEEDKYDEEEKKEDEESEEEKETEKDAKDHYRDSGLDVKATQSRTRGKYRCETCKKVFRSYQALGGHRASHKRIKVNINSSAEEPAMVEAGNAGASCGVVEEKVHQCPVCYRVFSSGQALGGHRRSHVLGASNISVPAKPFSRFGETLIDLNLPAPMDDDDISQIELSAVSDAEFVHYIRH